MKNVPEAVAEFLRGRRIAVAGVSRQQAHAANAIARKFRSCGYEVFPINPNATTVDGGPCYASPADVPAPVDGIVIATHPQVGESVVRQAVACDIRRIWFHRSFGQGSVSQAALDACRSLGVQPIVGGCPLMFCEPVDVGHRCIRWWLGLRGRVPR